MLIRWVVRVALSVAAFFLGSFVTFLLVGNAFWSDSSESPEFPTQQDLGNIITTAAGLAIAVGVWVLTKRLTAESSENESDHPI